MKNGIMVMVKIAVFAGLTLLIGCPNLGVPSGGDFAQLGVVGSINGTLVDHDGAAVDSAEIEYYMTVQPRPPLRRTAESFLLPPGMELQ